MKPKHLLLIVVLIVASCKVTEKNVVGFYQTDEAHLKTLSINLTTHSYIPILMQ
jgi:hypothetical protein